MQLRDIPVSTPVVVGDRVVAMPQLKPGDSVVPVARTGDLLVIPVAAHDEAAAAVEEAHAAFEALGSVGAEAVSAFFDGFAARLANRGVWERVAGANARDVARASAAGRHVGRLRVSEKMRRAMIDGLRGWAHAVPRVGEVVERREEGGYVIERRRAPLGVVAFVFEGRPNVFADGAGVVRNGNTAVMRIGSDALGTALAIEEDALAPALSQAGLPPGTVRLVRSADRASGQALFMQPKVRLAVARGSGAAVSLLGSIAEQHGIPASLHGAGGAWVYADASAPAATVANVVRNSLDRKVCNTLNVLVLDREGAGVLEPVVRDVFEGLGAIVHEPSDEAELAQEWEWDDRPELSYVVADGFEHAVRLVNSYSPHFVASIVSGRPGAFEAFYSRVDVPYVGNGFTRWVDGQWAWGRPELGLTNWERGRLLGRSGILSGDDIMTVRDVFIDTTGAAPQAR